MKKASHIQYKGVKICQPYRLFTKSKTQTIQYVLLNIFWKFYMYNAA